MLRDYEGRGLSDASTHQITNKSPEAGERHEVDSSWKPRERTNLADSLILDF